MVCVWCYKELKIKKISHCLILNLAMTNNVFFFKATKFTFYNIKKKNSRLRNNYKQQCYKNELNKNVFHNN